jgi:methylmalonyl-CoA mutase cobalamin-binding domain/chain
MLMKFIDDFVTQDSNEIIRANAKGATDAEIEATRNRIMGLDTIVAGNLLVAMAATSDIRVADGKFLNSMGAYNPDIQDALLYEMRRTGNVNSLTDGRLFTNDASRAFNRLGSEAASMWFDSIGTTGEAVLLTDPRVLNDAVIDVMRVYGWDAGSGSGSGRDAESGDGSGAGSGWGAGSGANYGSGSGRTGKASESVDGKLAGEYCQAIVNTRDVSALTSQEFLASLKGISAPLRAEVLSGIWYTKSAGWATPEVVGRIGSGELDVWRNVARTPDGAAMPKVVIVGLNDGHDRGSKLIAQSIRDSGFDVIYVGNASSREIVNIARAEGASAIGFSLAGDSYQHIVADVLRQVKVPGASEVSVFCGGPVGQRTFDILQRAGAKTFGQGTTREDLLGFLNGSALLRSQQPTSIQANARSALMSGSASGAFNRVYAPLTVSAASDGVRYGPAAARTASVGGLIANSYLRYERAAAGAAASDMEEELKKARKLASIADAEAHGHAAMPGMPYWYAHGRNKAADGGISIGGKMASSDTARSPLSRAVSALAMPIDALSKVMKVAVGQNGLIAAASASLIAPTQPAPSLFTVGAHLDLKLMKSRMYTLAGVKLTDLQLPAGALSKDQKKDAHGTLSLRQQGTKLFRKFFVQARTRSSRPRSAKMPKRRKSAP